MAEKEIEVGGGSKGLAHSRAGTASPKPVGQASSLEIPRADVAVFA